MLLYNVESNSQEHEMLTNAVMDAAVKAAENVFFEVNLCSEELLYSSYLPLRSLYQLHNFLLLFP